MKKIIREQQKNNKKIAAFAAIIAALLVATPAMISYIATPAYAVRVIIGALIEGPVNAEGPTLANEPEDIDVDSPPVHVIIGKPQITNVDEGDGDDGGDDDTGECNPDDDVGVCQDRAGGDSGDEEPLDACPEC